MNHKSQIGQSINHGAGRRAHLIGVCGSGMRALAEFLVDAGWRVSGSDQSPSQPASTALRAVGVELVSGHHAGHLARDVDLVVHSAAVPESNVERTAAAANEIVDLSYPETLGCLMHVHRGVAIAGTHGKTTTTAMLGWILQEAGWNPSVIGGGELRGLDRSGWQGSGELLVLEACEYGRHFLELRPEFATVLNIEPDHFDSFPDMESVIEAYCGFLANVSVDGGLVLNGILPSRDRLVSGARCRVESCGASETDDWCVTEVGTADLHVRFELRHKRQFRAHIELSHPGRYNVANAATAAALASQLGVPGMAIVDGLRSFPGVRRRFEICGSDGGVLWVDDYAHHPTAIHSVLTAVREELGGGGESGVRFSRTRCRVRIR